MIVIDGIKEALLEGISNQISFTIPLFGGIPVPQSLAITWGIMVLLVAASILCTRKLSMVPGKPQLVLELFVGFINDFAKNNLGEHWRPYAPYLGTVALYIACANMAGVFGFTPPTKDLNVTAALSLMSVAMVYGASLRSKGLRGGLHKFIEPVPILLPINLLEVGIRPLSLCMRLFGNVLGSFIIMELIKTVVPAIVPMAFSLYFDVFDGVIQTIVFVFLTTLFTQESLE